MLTGMRRFAFCVMGEGTWRGWQECVCVCAYVCKGGRRGAVIKVRRSAI